MLEIETSPVEQIVAYVFNNKIHTPEQIDRIASSISLYGMNQPIVIDENNVILVGHGRFAACQKLGWKQVPVVRKLGLTEAEKKAYRIADNKTASDTSYDYSNLAIELKSLEEMGFSASTFGFDEFKMPDVIQQAEPAPEPSPQKGEWIGKITLKVPAEEIDLFEADLDDLLRRYDGISKEVQRAE